SASVRNALSRRVAGRSKGVIVSFVQIPCRLGWPSGVFDGIQSCAARFGWAVTTALARAIKATRASPTFRLMCPPGRSSHDHRLNRARLHQTTLEHQLKCLVSHMSGRRSASARKAAPSHAARDSPYIAPQTVETTNLASLLADVRTLVLEPQARFDFGADHLSCAC